VGRVECVGRQREKHSENGEGARERDGRSEGKEGEREGSERVFEGGEGREGKGGWSVFTRRKGGLRGSLRRCAPYTTV